MSQSQQPSQEQAPLSPQAKMQAAQADAEHWKAVASNPDLSPKAAAWALDLARSAQAEVRLRQKGLAWQAEQAQNPLLQTDDQALAQILGLNSSPPNQQNPSPMGNQSSSTSPGTSASKT
jgi:hypothetical protein